MTPDKIQGVIFDLDGTLLNTLDDIAEAMNTILRRYEYPEHPAAEYRYFVGDGVDQLVKRVVPSSVVDEELFARYENEFQEEYRSMGNNKTAPYPGIKEILEELATKRMPQAILSNKPHEITAETVQYFFSEYHFDACIGGGVFPKKPDPEAALYITMVMGIKPENCLYVGDTGTDMKTAQTAGIPSVGVLWGFRDEEELRKNGAQWIVHHPSEILDLIDNG
jgi:phosphoglycolate phosphatase